MAETLALEQTKTEGRESRKEKNRRLKIEREQEERQKEIRAAQLIKIAVDTIRNDFDMGHSVALMYLKTALAREE